MVACLRTANVQRAVSWHDLWYVPNTYVKSEDRYLRLLDVLISVSNSLELVGKVAQVTKLPCQATLGAFISAIRPSCELDAKFYFRQLASPEVQSIIRQNASTTTNISNVSSGRLVTVELKIPPLPEQHRIVAEIEKQFTRLDASVESLKRARANLKRYRASVLKSACEGTLVPTEAELARAEGREYELADALLERILAERCARWESQEKKRGKYKKPVAPDTSALPELPEGWVWATTSQVGTSQLGKMLDKKRSAGTFHQYLRNLNVRWNAFDLTDLAEMPFFHSEFERFALHNGDVLVAEGGEPGRSAVWRGDERPIKFQKALHRVRLEEGVLPEWLVIRLWASAQTGILESFFTGSTIKHFTGESLNRFPVPLPPLPEQNRIVAEVERCLSVIQQSEAVIATSLARAERLRQSILKQAFSGQLVPQDPSDEPAWALLERIKAEREAVQAAEAPKSRTRRARAAFSRPAKDAGERQLTLPEAST